MSDAHVHQPVLLSAVLEGLRIKPAGIYVDATFGRGGHSLPMLDKLNQQGRLVAIDKDPSAIAVARAIKDKRLTVCHGSFTTLNQIAMRENITGLVDGILLDLGVSSPQLDDAQRGFSFRHEGPLDMRMDNTQGIPVSQWLRQVSEETLCQIIKTYGEEKFAKKISRAIIHEIKNHPIETTTHLARIIAKAHPAWTHDRHPATKTFQALRIYMNNELKDLKTVLPQCLNVLATGGRLLVISFHSLEDRIVKRFINHQMTGEIYLRQLPIRQKALNPQVQYIKKMVRPDIAETNVNPRARSAILRIVEKI